MKPYRIAYLFAIALLVLSASSCVTETTTTTFEDGRTETTVKQYPSQVYADVAGALAKEAIERKIYNDKP